MLIKIHLYEKETVNDQVKKPVEHQCCLFESQSDHFLFLMLFYFFFDDQVTTVVHYCSIKDAHEAGITCLSVTRDSDNNTL